MKKIIITGGLGFIGTNYIEFLLNKKNKIYNLDKISKCSNNKFYKNFTNYKFIKIDLSNNFKKLEKLIRKINPELIINFAANSHVDNSINDPSNFFRNNVQSTLNILNIIKENEFKNKIKFIHIGTDEIYGEIKKNQKKNI